MAVESMRRGAVSTTRAMSEQAVASDQITKESGALARQIGEISKAMTEQSKASAEIAEATQSMRLQAEQVSKAMREQARTSHEMTIGVTSVSRDAMQITTSNRNHLEAAERVRTAVNELRDITNRNASGVKITLVSTTGLAQQARELGEIMDSMVKSNQTGNGDSKTRRKRTAKPTEDNAADADQNQE